MTQYNEQQREYGPRYATVADVRGVRWWRGGWLVVMGSGLMCVCIGEGVMLNDLFIKFTNQKPVCLLTLSSKLERHVNLP